MNTDRLFDVFAGSFVYIMIKPSVKGKSYAFQGYLLDHCPDFVYLGTDPSSIFAAVIKDEILSVSLSEGDNSMETINTEVQ